MDPALPPVLQTLIGSDAEQIAPLAMKLVAAQSQFIQQQMRMQLPFGQIPGDLLHKILCDWRAAGARETAAAMTKAETIIRRNYNEGDSRLALLERFCGELESYEYTEMSVSQLGLSLFATRLAQKSGQERARVILSFDPSQSVRMFVSLTAAGMSADQIVRQFATIYGDDIAMPDLGTLSPDEARSLLHADGHERAK